MTLNATRETPKDETSVLVLGGTGRTGVRVVRQLLERGVSVRAIVRSAARLPEDVLRDPRLTVIEAGLLSLTREELGRALDGCNTVISCLGHTTSVRGVFGPPSDLVTRAVTRLARIATGMQRATPMRFILMSSVSVNRPARADTIRGTAERVFLTVLRGLVPPARDNQRAADFLAHEVGPNHSAVEWVVVRPDTLLEGDVSEYRLSSELVSSIFRPDKTNRASVAHFMCELAERDSTWERWKGCMPVIVNEMKARSS